MSGLILDLEDCIARGAPGRRAETMRRVTDLFMREAEKLNDEQIGLFDIVISRLSSATEIPARAELAERLADLPNAPKGVVRSLAEDEIMVARPILERFARLTDEDLVAIALAKGRDHMLAICERPLLNEPVSDVLMLRGDQVVLHAVARNPGARFSEPSLAELVERSRGDDALQMLLGQRADLPEGRMREIMALSKGTARRRLVEATRPALEGVGRRAAVKSTGDYSHALGLVQALSERGALAEASLVAFAEAGQFEETVCGLALLAGLSIPATERLFAAGETDLILVVAKSLGWGWPTAKAFLRLKGGADATDRYLKRAFESYETLSATTAKRILHFLQVREAAQVKQGVTVPAAPLNVVRM